MRPQCTDKAGHLAQMQHTAAYFFLCLLRLLVPVGKHITRQLDTDRHERPDSIHVCVCYIVKRTHSWQSWRKLTEAAGVFATS